MSPFFLVLALTVAASLLLSLAAVARTIWLRLRPAGAAQLGVEQSPPYSNASDSLLLLAVGLSCYSVAAGWAAGVLYHLCRHERIRAASLPCLQSRLSFSVGHRHLARRSDVSDLGSPPLGAGTKCPEAPCVEHRC